MENLINELYRISSVPAEDIFDIRQGIATGANEVFIIDHNLYADLSKQEKGYFKEAVLSDDISNGALGTNKYVFYPYVSGKLAIQDEEALAERVPFYYSQRLRPARARLSSRSSITRQASRKWWELSERRAWTDRSEPRLLSKHFGSLGSFAADIRSTYAVIQCYAWYLRSHDEPKSPQDPPLAPEDIILAYATIFNSSLFFKLVANFAPVVSGGQFNLSIRYLRMIPLPALVNLAKTSEGLELFHLLRDHGRQVRPDSGEWLDKANRLARSAYAVAPELWSE